MTYRSSIGTCEICGETLLFCRHLEGDALRALLACEHHAEICIAVGWENGYRYDVCGECLCDDRKHEVDCRTDAVLRHYGLPDAASRDAARAEIARR